MWILASSDRRYVEILGIMRAFYCNSFAFKISHALHFFFIFLTIVETLSCEVIFLLNAKHRVTNPNEKNKFLFIEDKNESNQHLLSFFFYIYQLGRLKTTYFIFKGYSRWSMGLLTFYKSPWYQNQLHSVCSRPNWWFDWLEGSHLFPTWCFYFS